MNSSSQNKKWMTYSIELSRKAKGRVVAGEFQEQKKKCFA
jgi:hypothetical protein